MAPRTPDHASGSALRPAHAGQEPRVHGHRRALAGARHRRQHRHLQPRQRRAAQTDPGRRPGAARRGLHDRRAQPGQPAALAPQLQGSARPEPGLHRDGGVHVRPGELEHGHRVRTDAAAGRERQLLLGARRADRARPRIPAGRRREANAGRRGQPRVLGTQPRTRSADRRQDADAQSHGLYRRRRRATGIHGHDARRRPVGLGADVDARRRAAELRLVRAAARPLPLCVRPPEAGGLHRAGVGPAANGLRRARAGVPRRQQGTERRRCAAARGSPEPAGAGRRAGRAPLDHPDDRRRHRAADRVRQRRQPAARARDPPAQGNRVPAGARRRQMAARPAARHREHAAVGGRRRPRAAPRLLAARRARRHRSGAAAAGRGRASPSTGECSSSRRPSRF